MTVPVEIQTLIQGLVLAAIGYGIRWITLKIAVWAESQNELMRTRIGQDNLILIDEAAKWVVRSVEQSGTAGLIRNTAKEKKAEAIKQLGAYLDMVGLTNVDEEMIGNAIEAAVLNGLNQAKVVVNSDPTVTITTNDTSVSKPTGE